jgi:chromosome partitioning protein
MARTIAIANQKGGVGKTTTTVNLGVALAELGKKVLAVDLDPQGALSAGLGRDGYVLRETIYNALVEPNFPVSRIVYPVQANLDLIPANLKLEAAEHELLGEMRREFVLRRALSPLYGWYDLVLVDCPPSLGLLTTNALCACGEVLIPVQCEFLAMRGLRLLLEAVREIRNRLNPELDLAGILPTMYTTGTVHSREVLKEIQAAFGRKVFDVVVYKSIRFPESSGASQSIIDYAQGHKGAGAYRKLAMQLLTSPGSSKPGS